MNMRVVAALGGNALMRRGEPQTMATQQQNAKRAANALVDIINSGNQLIVTHGNGPQVGRLANQSYAYSSQDVDSLDVLGAQTEGMIGYLLEQELGNALHSSSRLATVLTRVEVDRNDPAFLEPVKQIGPQLDETEASVQARDRGWTVRAASGGLRRVVPSPKPKRIVELEAIRLLVDHSFIVICAGGGGIPVSRDDSGQLCGVEAVIDKDRTSAELAIALDADALLLLTDVQGVYRNWNNKQSKPITELRESELTSLELEAGSIAPKVEAGFEFVKRSSGIAVVGELKDAVLMINGEAGTRLRPDN